MSTVRLARCTLLAILWPMVCLANDAENRSPTATHQLISPTIEFGATTASDSSMIAAPICGIESLRLGLNILSPENSGNSFDIMKPEFVSREGSSAYQLIEAAKFSGVDAEYRKHLSIFDLKQLNSPAILRVRQSGRGSAFNHWVLFLGFDQNGVRIVDFPGASTTVTEGELLSIWDNSAVILMRRGFDVPSITSYLYFGTLVLAGVLSIRALSWICAYLKKRNRTIVQWLAIIVTPILFQAVVEVTGLGCYFIESDSIAQVSNRNSPWEPKVIESAEDLCSQVDGDSVIIDSRDSESFRAGHIPTARSIAFFSSIGERKLLLTGVSKQQKVIIYCQSARCPYANYLADVLHEEGYAPISIYKGGFNDWRRYVRQASKR